MTFPARRTLRAAVCAVALTLGLATAASAAPIVPASPAAPVGERSASAGLPIEQVQSRGGRGGGHYRGGGRPGGGNYHGGGRPRGGYHHGGNWNRHGWNGNHRGWYGPRYYGPRRYYGGTGLYLGFGVPAYRYYDPYYLPAPVYRPRVYRARPVGNAHVAWCYERYRSYRDYDNTFQPYNGPRRQCRSPYG